MTIFDAEWQATTRRVGERDAIFDRLVPVGTFAGD